MMTTAILIAASLYLGCLNCHGIPDFCASPTVVATGGELASDPAAIVVVPKGVTATVLAGQVVTVHSAGVHGRLLVLGELRVVNGLTYEDGVDQWADGSRLVIRDVAPTDPSQWGTGWITSGKTTYSGSPRQPAARVVGNLAVGQTVIPVDDHDWQVGDEVVIPDVRQGLFAVDSDQHERRKITEVAEGSVKIDSGLQWAHKQPLWDGSAWADIPILNLTRGIKVTSENPNGTRGHWAAVGRADVRLTGVEFSGLGRSEYVLENMGKAFPRQTKTVKNLFGRYSGPHLHHVYGPLSSHNGQQFEIRGCSVHDVNKNGWGFTIHQSHYGLVQDCVFWGGHSGVNSAGAGFVTEDGPEYRNTFVNCVSGNALTAFWFIGPEQTINQCVAIDSAWAYEFGREGLASPTWKYPDQRGEEPATYASRREKEFVPVDFSSNEAIACNQVGINWTHCAKEQVRTETAPILMVHGPMKAWNCLRGYNGYYDDFAVKLVGWKMLSDPSGTPSDNEAFAFGGKSCSRIEIEDSESFGHAVGYYHRPRGDGSRAILRNTKLFAKTSVLGAVFQMQPTFGSVDLLLSNCTLAPRRSNETHLDIDISGSVPTGKNVAPMLPSTVRVVNPAESFAVFWTIQAADAVIKDAAGVPPEIVGLTNQQAFAKIGKSLLGGIAPTTTRPGIKGFVKPSGTPPTPPVPKRVDVILRDGLKPADVVMEIKPVDVTNPITVKVTEQP